ncbi:alpha/beta fold hydrolase [Streptomyces sp. NRRL F-5126]|uniref:alpha/beta fold hydrolase n=1 Tax=Streptomyces sp. NRRL F-5126 TaxID=1463857 RepID=UPI0004CA1901|nr:alpha/beta fold hydrolase [Streptomyces sp. NRRL F-5126]
MITAEYTLPGIHVRDHRVDVPLDWAVPDGPAIAVFARELVDPERRREDLPYLTYLQGGPGGKSPRPTARSGWIGEALKTHRVVLLDQRGTGRSTPVDGSVMAALGTAEAGAAYLSHFLAPSIVADAEHLRKTVFAGRPWTTLGQSYGGFLTLCYLSQAPEGLHACLVTGGLASVTQDASAVYRHTYPRAEAKNRIYRERYPHDVDVVARVADRVAAGDVVLPDGDVLTVRRLQTLGFDFGMKPGFERMHWLFDEAFAEGPVAGERLTDTFLAGVRDRTAFHTNPLYAALQETIYAGGAGATAWAAERERAARTQFGEDVRPLLFTGEMVYPWMFEEIRALRPFRPAVELLAARDEWPRLYDLDRLAANEVPLAAAVYFDDMYVDSGLQLETASRVGNAHAWVTNEYEHDGLHEDVRVFSHLRGMLKDKGLFGTG